MAHFNVARMRVAVLSLTVGVFATAASLADPPAAATPSAAPSAAAPSQAPASPASSTSAPASANAAATAPRAGLETGGLSEADVRRAFAKLRKQTRGGKELWCRSETVLGSRFARTVCYTEEQVLSNARAERSTQDMMSQRSVCGTSVCSPGGM